MLGSRLLFQALAIVNSECLQSLKGAGGLCFNRGNTGDAAPCYTPGMRGYRWWHTLIGLGIVIAIKALFGEAALWGIGGPILIVFAGYSIHQRVTTGKWPRWDT